MPEPSAMLRYIRRNLAGVVFSALLSLILAMGIWAFMVYTTVKNRTEGEILASHQSQAELGARFISDHQQRLMDRMSSLAGRPDFLDATASRDAGALSAILKGMSERLDVSWLFVTDPEGSIIFHLPRAPERLGQGLAERDFMKKAMQEAVPHISALTAEPGPGSEKVIIFMAPLKDPQRGVLGFFGLQQKRSYWDDSFARMAGLPGQRVFLFDQAGSLVAGGSRDSQELAEMNKLGRLLAGSGRPGMRVAGRLMEDPLDKEPVFVTAALAPPMNWLLIIAHDYDTAMAAVLLVFRNLLLFLVLLLICLLLVTFLLHSRYRLQQQALVRADEETIRLDNEVRLRTRDLRNSNIRIRELSGHLIAAQEDERKRIALDLHDEVGSHLGALSVGLRQLAQDNQGQAALDRRYLGRLSEISDRLIGHIRSLSYALRPTILDQLGLKAALADLCEFTQETFALPVRANLAGMDESLLTPQQKLTLYRFAQEGINNAVKHSGTGRIDLALTLDAGFLRLSVSDQGRGFDAQQEQSLALAGKKMGLLGMSERLELAGGRLEISSGEGGTTLTAILPWGENHAG